MPCHTQWPNGNIAHLMRSSTGPRAQCDVNFVCFFHSLTRSFYPLPVLITSSSSTNCNSNFVCKPSRISFHYNIFVFVSFCFLTLSFIIIVTFGCFSDSRKMKTKWETMEMCKNKNMIHSLVYRHIYTMCNTSWMRENVAMEKEMAKK